MSDELTMQVVCDDSATFHTDRGDRILGTYYLETFPDGSKIWTEKRSKPTRTRRARTRQALGQGGDWSTEYTRLIMAGEVDAAHALPKPWESPRYHFDALAGQEMRPETLVYMVDGRPAPDQMEQMRLHIAGGDVHMKFEWQCKCKLTRSARYGDVAPLFDQLATGGVSRISLRRLMSIMDRVS